MLVVDTGGDGAGTELPATEVDTTGDEAGDVLVDDTAGDRPGTVLPGVEVDADVEDVSGVEKGAGGTEVADVAVVGARKTGDAISGKP